MNFQTETTLFHAAIESARIFNAVAISCASSSGLLDLLPEFVSADVLARRLKCNPEKLDSLVCFLDLLHGECVIERKMVNGRLLYRAAKGLDRDKLIKGNGAVFYTTKQEIIQPWFGANHVEKIRTMNKNFLGSDLSYFQRPEKRREFGGEYLGTWKMNLSNPLYEFGRIIAVKELAERGTRFLDLACGLGYGSERLAQMVNGATIMAVDKSADMLREARAGIYPGARVTFVHKDLNNGLPYILPGTIDGILFNGAFHFISDKKKCLAEMAACMRVGGVLAIGHCFCQSNFEDEAMHQFYFSTLLDKTYITTFENLRRLLLDAGLSPYKEYHRGSHSYIIAEKVNQAPAMSSSNLP